MTTPAEEMKTYLYKRNGQDSINGKLLDYVVELKAGVARLEEATKPVAEQVNSIDKRLTKVEETLAPITRHVAIVNKCVVYSGKLLKWLIPAAIIVVAKHYYGVELPDFPGF